MGSWEPKNYCGQSRGNRSEHGSHQSQRLTGRDHDAFIASSNRLVKQQDLALEIIGSRRSIPVNSKSASARGIYRTFVRRLPKIIGCLPREKCDGSSLLSTASSDQQQEAETCNSFDLFSVKRIEAVIFR